MKTIDTSKLWHVHAETEHAYPEIVGPGGIVMDVYDATTEQAQEIADILNAATADQPLYIVAYRAGDAEVTYSAPTADEAMSMARQGEQRDAPLKYDPKTGMVITSDNLPEMRAKLLSELANAETGAWKDLAHKATVELDAWKDLARKNGAQADQALNERDKLLRERDDLQEEIERLTHARATFEDQAASYLKSMHWYQEQLDRCGVALGREAYISDDGSVQDKPLRAKVAELVEKMCVQRESSNPTAGPCAKQTVRATIVTPSGMRFVGENDCLNPQTACPRADMKTGEGYHLCVQVCKQTGHAEINALKAAGPAARGAVMYVEGHTYACEPCQLAALDAGIRFIVLGAPPAQGEKA